MAHSCGAVLQQQGVHHAKIMPLGRRLRLPLYKQNQEFTMEAERINLIGTTLDDLSTRTQELRRYL